MKDTLYGSTILTHVATRHKQCIYSVMTSEILLSTQMFGEAQSFHYPSWPLDALSLQILLHHLVAIVSTPNRFRQVCQ